MCASIGKNRNVTNKGSTLTICSVLSTHFKWFRSPFGCWCLNAHVDTSPCVPAAHPGFLRREAAPGSRGLTASFTLCGDLPLLCCRLSCSSSRGCFHQRRLSSCRPVSVLSWYDGMAILWLPSAFQLSSRTVAEGFILLLMRSVSASSLDYFGNF